MASWLSLVVIGSVLPIALLANPAAAAGDGPSLTLQTSGGIVRDDSVISSGTEMTSAVGSLLEPGSGTRELRIDLDDATVYKASGVTAPEGWTIEWSTNDGSTWVTSEPGTPADVTSVRATASVVAGAINGSSQLYTKEVISPVPASTFSGSTGGDGWDVFFYDDYVLNIFHHQSSYMAMDCHLRSTGARCTGFDPTQTSGSAHSRFSGYMTASRSGGWVDGNTGYAYAFTADNNSGSPTRYSPGALCIDLNVAPPVSCGFTALSTNTNVTGYSPLSNAEGVGGRLFGMDATNQELLCYDPTTSAACTGSPISVSGGTTTSYYHVYGLGTKVFASTNTNLYCFESATLSPCAGSWPVSYASLSWTAASISPVAHMNASGTIDGICMWNGCLDLSGADQTYDASTNPSGWVNPHSITTWASSASGNGSSGQYGKFEATAGRAYLQRVLSTNTVFCFDYATEAACSGFDTTPTSDTALYALRADPNNPACLWYNSDPGKIGLFDAYTGAAECSANPVITLQPSAFAPRFVCTTSGGIDRWSSLTLDTVSGGTPASQTLTVRTGNGDAVDGWTNRSITIGETLSLADLAVADTGARPTFNIGFSGVTGGALTSADFTILYEGRGPELCVDFLVDNTSASGSPNCPLVQSIVGTLAENVSGPVTDTALSRSFTASGSNTECPENIVYAGPPGPVRSLATTSSSPGQAVVTFQAPSDDGGSPIRWYEVSTDGGTTWSVIANTPDGGGNLSHTMNITPGPYTFKVRAVNLLGNGTGTDVAATVIATTTTTTTAPPTTTTTTTPSTTSTTTPSTTIATTTTTTATTSTTTTTTSTTTPPTTSGGAAPTTPPPTVARTPEGPGSEGGAIPDLEPGQSIVSDDGEAIPATITVLDGTSLEIDTGDGVKLELSGDCGGPCKVAVGNDDLPYLVFSATGTVRASGEGFRLGTNVDVWITEGPTYLGRVAVRSDGTFDKVFDVEIDPGQYTLQVNGITATGGERSANLGLLITAALDAAVSPEELAYTGSSMTIVYIGLGMLLAGAVVVVGARRFSTWAETV